MKTNDKLIIEPSSNLPLQIVIFTDKIFNFLYTISNFTLLLFKAYVMFYTSSKIIGEVVGIIIYFLLSLTKLKFLGVGNKTEKVWMIFIGLILEIPIIIIYIYYIKIQTYVVVYDIILNAIGFLLAISEGLLSFLAIINIFSNEKKF